MTWVKLDDRILLNPKQRAAGLHARALYIAGLCYCARELTDGRIPKAFLSLIAAEADVKPAAAKKLVEVGLWHLDGDAYVVNDYLSWNPSGAEARARREARATAGRIGGLRSGQSRNGSKREANDEANTEANGKQTTKQTGSKPRTPVPEPGSYEISSSHYTDSSEPTEPKPEKSNYSEDPRWRRAQQHFERHNISAAETARQIAELRGQMADHLVDAAVGQAITADAQSLAYLRKVAANWYEQRVTA